MTRPNETQRGYLAMWVLAAAAIALLVWSFTAEARAHQAPLGWAYPLSCCSNKDCNEIHSDRVQENGNSYEVTLYPGDHDFVKEEPVSFIIPASKAKPSPDGRFHICIGATLRLICFFAPPNAF